MRDWSQGSVYPLSGATTNSVSDNEFDTLDAPVTRWAELYRLLVVPGTVGYALRAVDGQEPVREASGDPAELMAQAEHAGAGQAAWAVVAPIRPDLLVVDLDHCADLVLDRILGVADDAAAQLAYLAASGSDDSVHVVLACPTRTSREYLLDRVAAIRTWENLSATQLDVRTATQFLRLPGSAPLKADGGWCYPIDESGRRVTATAAAHRAHRAILELHSTPHNLTSLPSAGRPRRRLTVAPAEALDTAPSSSAAPDEWDLLDHERPRAWRLRRPFTSQQWALLHHTPDEGQRSHAATAAAWALWQNGIRSWKRAAGWYRACPAFGKFAARDDHGRAHWEAIKARALNYRPADPAADDRIRSVLAEIVRWDDPSLVAAAYACIVHRFADGHGIEARPIAWRDLAEWLTVSVATAGRRLHELAVRGALTVAQPHDRATAPHEATCYTLTIPAAIYRTDMRHDVTLESSSLHPLWGTLGQPAHSLWAHLDPHTPTPTRTLAHTLGIAPGTLSYGARRWLDRLERSGLAVRRGVGRATSWVRGPATLDEAAKKNGVLEFRTQLLRTINAEREAWHAPTVRMSHAVRLRTRALLHRHHPGRSAKQERGTVGARGRRGQFALDLVFSSEGHSSGLGRKRSSAQRGEGDQDRDHRQVPP